MREMIPFTDEAIGGAHAFLHRIPWGKRMSHAVKPELMDPVPELNARGGRDIPAGGWRTVYSLVVDEEMCNPMENLHGGAAATINDSVSSASLSLLATDTFWGLPMLSGVSIVLDTQYYNAAPLGCTLRITVTVENVTGTMANIRTDIEDWDTGKRYATGTHVKTWRNMLKGSAKAGFAKL